MSKRLRIIALATAAALVVLVIGIYAGVLNTGAGRRAVLDALGPTLNQAVGGEVRVGGTGGHWPHHIVLRDVTISDAAGTWVELPELTVRWNPLALFSGRIGIDELTIPDGTLHRFPESPEKEPEPPGLPRIPKLPNIGIKTLDIGPLNVKRAAAGRDTVLRLTGTADTQSDHLKLVLKANTEADRADRVDADIDWMPAEDRLKAEVLIEGPEDGLLAHLVGVENEAVSVSISGTGPASNWVGATRVSLGELGGLFGNITCECSKKPRFVLAFDAAPGPALSESLRGYLGENPRLEATLSSPKASAWTIELTRLEAAAGRLTSPLRIELTEGWQLLRFDVSAGFEPGPALEDSVPPWLGNVFDLSGRGAFDSKGGVRVAAVTISTKAVRLNVEKGRLSGDGDLDGNVALTLLSAKNLPDSITGITGREATLGFGLAGNTAKIIRVQNLKLETQAGTRAEGSLDYGLKGRIAEAELDLALPAPVFAKLAGVPEPDAPVTGMLTAMGPLDNLAATLHVRTPQLPLEARPLPPAATTLDLKNVLNSPLGTLAVTRRDRVDAPPLLRADIAWPGRQILHVTGIRADLDGARLEGEAHLETATGGLTGKAKLDVPDLGALADTASGSLSADLSLERRSGADLVLTAQAETPELRYGEYEASDLKASASGPLARMKVAAQADYLNVPGVGSIRDLDTAGAVSAGEATEIALAKLSAVLNGTALALVSPASLTLKEGGLVLPSAVFSWGESGRLTAGAEMTPEMLTAKLDMNKAAIPGQSVLATGTISVDTEKEQPGAIELRLDPRRGPQVFLDIGGTWNGQTLDLKGAVSGYGKRSGLGRSEILTASVPLVLTREEGGISLSTEGTLNARLKYQGKLEALTAVFLAGEERLLAGKLDADIAVTGPLDSLEAKGSAVLTGGRFENMDAGLVLTAIDARLAFAGGMEAASGTLKLTAWDGEDSGKGKPPIRGEGQVTLEPAGLSVNADIRLRKAELVQRGDLEATLSGTANLSGTLPRLELTGDIRIDKLDLNIPENQPEGVVDVSVVLVDEQGEPLNPEEKKTEDQNGAFELALNLNVRSDGQAFIRGRGLDSEWKADLKIGGTADELKLNGTLTVKKGKLAFAGRDFDLADGEIAFTGQTPPDPVLKVAAEHETEEGTRAIVRVSGRASDPEITLDSMPAMPREQVMALVLFGKPVTELTALQALQVTQSIAQLTGTGPFGGGGGIMDRVRRTLGLDLLDLTFGQENGEVGLKIGRYVSEGVFVSASQDATGEGGKVSVEVEITDEFSVQTDVGQDASGGVSAQWKKDY